jgi:GntR family transcriptional repressor for pyruvate dehydrogenase complex
MVEKLMLTTIKTTRISENIAEQLENLIREEKLIVGAKLPSERSLMAMLGVGRGAVREALRILEIKGYIESRQGVGAFVKDFDGETLLPLSVWLADQNEALASFFEMRLFIEPNAASLAAKRITPKEVEELRKTHQAFCESVEKGDLTRAIIEDANFHKTIANATKNKFLALTMESLHNSMIKGWKASLRVPGRNTKTIVEHGEVINAIAEKDRAKAAMLMRKHLITAIADLKKAGLNVECDAELDI